MVLAVSRVDSKPTPKRSTRVIPSNKAVQINAGRQMDFVVLWRKFTFPSCLFGHHDKSLQGAQNFVF